MLASCLSFSDKAKVQVSLARILGSFFPEYNTGVKVLIFFLRRDVQCFFLDCASSTCRLPRTSILKRHRSKYRIGPLTAKDIQICFGAGERKKRRTRSIRGLERRYKYLGQGN